MSHPRPDPDQALRYTRTAVTLHWTLALLLAGTFVLGLLMSDLPTSPQKLRWFNWHKWAGATALALSGLRLAWRLGHPPPPELPAPHWQQRAARLVHGAMYGLFFAVPLIGWAYSSALGFPLVWFGLLQLPDFVPVDRALADAIKPWHGRAAWLLTCLVGLHLVAIVKHQVIDRDGTVRRMSPLRR